MDQKQVNRLMAFATEFGHRRNAELAAALDQARAEGAAVRNREVMAVYGIGLAVGFAAGIVMRWAWGKPR